MTVYACPHTHFLSDIPVTAILGKQTCQLDLKNAIQVWEWYSVVQRRE